jgi:hypothetical protein
LDPLAIFIFPSHGKAGDTGVLGAVH